MSQAFIQKAASAGQWPSGVAASNAVTLSGVTSTDDIYLPYACSAQGAVPTVSDTGTYGSIETVIQNNNYGSTGWQQGLLRLINCSSGSHQITLTAPGGAFGWFHPCEFAGDVTSAHDQANSNAGIGTALTTGSITLSQNTELVFALVSGSANIGWSSITGPSGFSNISSTTSDVLVPYSFDYQIVTSGGSFNPAYTIGTSDTWGGSVGSVAAVTAGSSTVRVNRLKRIIVPHYSFR